MFTKTTKAAKSIINNVVNIIYPPQCFSCNVSIYEHGHLCPECWESIQFVRPPYCQKCSFPFEYSIEGENLCAECIKSPPAFNKARCAFLYDDNSRKIVTSFKFGDKTHSHMTLAKMMISSATDLLKEVDIIVPVPLHRLRLLKRKYNQSAILAHSISKYTDIAVVPDLLIRNRNTPPQSGLTQRQRHKNMKNAFSVREKYHQFIDEKKVMLIDDVMTTGATIEACTKALFKSGAAEVYVLTLARRFLNQKD
ncbi:ComF family protein [Rickettsiales bacterium]|nr:ComF family protein [Rickettsiales bacterium]